MLSRWCRGSGGWRGGGCVRFWRFFVGGGGRWGGGDEKERGMDFCEGLKGRGGRSSGWRVGRGKVREMEMGFGHEHILWQCWWRTGGESRDILLEHLSNCWIISSVILFMASSI